MPGALGKALVERLVLIYAQRAEMDDSYTHRALAASFVVAQSKAHALAAGWEAGLSSEILRPGQSGLVRVGHLMDPAACLGPATRRAWARHATRLPRCHSRRGRRPAPVLSRAAGEVAEPGGGDGNFGRDGRPAEGEEGGGREAFRRRLRRAGGRAGAAGVLGWRRCRARLTHRVISWRLARFLSQIQPQPRPCRLRRRATRVAQELVCGVTAHVALAQQVVETTQCDKNFQARAIGAAGRESGGLRHRRCRRDPWNGGGAVAGRGWSWRNCAPKFCKRNPRK